METLTKRKNYYLFVLGCQMNKSDAERLATLLEKIGFKKTEDEKKANLIIAVSCSVRQSAIDRILGKVKRWQELKRKKPLILGLTGCVLPKEKPKLLKYFDFFFEIKDLKKLPQVLGKKIPPEIEKIEEYFQIHPAFQSFFQAYVPISTGCDNFCTYCAVPYTRGKEISRPANEIICEIENLVKRNYKEIILLGQNVNSYNSELKIKDVKFKMTNKKSKRIKFPNLLRIINDISGDFWIRFLTSHPKDMSDELIDAVAQCQKVTEYIHLPVQSGDDGILKKMNRNYTVAHYKNLILKIRKKIPNIAISTDIIVGFPSETKDQFENTKKLMEEIGFDMAYIAQYSPRPGTAAALLEDNIPKKEKEKREKILTKILEKTGLLNNQKYVGKKMIVLVEEEKNGFLFGKTRTFKKVKFKGRKNLIGQFSEVKIKKALPFGLEGKFLR